MESGFFQSINKFVTDIKQAVSGLQERAVSISSIGNAVFDLFYNQGAWLNDLYLEDDEIFAVASDGGKLFRASVDIDENGDVTLGEMQEVVVKFDAVTRTKFRTNDAGKVQMLAVSASSVINKNGEIDSRSLFDAMSDYMKRTGKKIPRTFFHAGPEFRTGDIVWMARDDNVLLTLTEFDDSELAQREIKAREKDPDYWGDSIEYDPVGDPEMLDVGDGITIPVYRAGVPVAVSTLAAERACSLYANKFSINRQEVKRMTLKDEDRIDLVKAFDGDEAEADDWLKDNVSPINRKIAETGQVTRDATEESAEEEASEEEESAEELTDETSEEAEGSEEESSEEAKSEETEEGNPEEVIVEFDASMAEGVAEAVIDSSAFGDFQKGLLDTVTGIQEAIAELTGTVGEIQTASVARAKDITQLKKSDEQKQKEWMEDLPRNTDQNRKVHFRPSENGEETVPGAEKRSMEDTANETIATLE